MSSGTGSRANTPSTGGRRAPVQVTKSKSATPVRRRYGLLKLPVDPTDPFSVDASIDPLESSYQVQYVVVRLENITLAGDAAETAKQPAMPTIAMLRREATFRGSVASLGLLRCIRKVVQTGRLHRARAGLQELVLAHQRLTLNRGKRGGLGTPRSLVQLQDRLHHFDVMRRDATVSHYMHPGELPPELRPPCPTGATAGARLCGEGDADPRVRARADAAAAGPNARRSFSTPSASRRLLSELAAQANRIREDGHIRVESSAPVAGLADIKKNRSHRAAQGRLSNQLAPSQALMLTHQNHSSSLFIIKMPGQEREVQKRAIPAPRLSGATSGFEGVTLTSSGAQQVVERLCAHCLPPGSPQSIGGLPPKPPRGGGGGAETPLGSSSPTAAGLPDGVGRGGLAASAALSMSSAPSGTLAELATMRRSASDGSSSSSRSSPLRAAAERNTFKYAQMFLQQRGWELGGPVDAPSAPVLPAKGGRNMERAATYGALGGNHSAPLVKERCLPVDAMSSLHIPVDRTPLADWCWLPEVGYSRGCAQRMINPKLTKIFGAAAATRLDLAHQVLGDSDLEAILTGLQAPRLKGPDAVAARPTVVELNLAGNMGVSDGALSRFLTLALSGDPKHGLRPCMGALKRLSLAGCTGLGAQLLDTLSELLESDLARLEELDISGVRVPTAQWPKLVRGIGETAGQLRCLRLAQTGCGREAQSSCTLVASLLEHTNCMRLETLDIGGNHFLSEGCRDLGRTLRRSHQNLRELDLSHNAGGSYTGALEEEKRTKEQAMAPNPLMFVLESLGETTLERASFANCRLSHLEDCILEDSLGSSYIKTLDISDNPHGEEGLRSLVRVIAVSSNAAGRSKLDNVCLRSVRPFSLSKETLTYDYVNPAMGYRLCLEYVQHRSLLRLLLKRSEEVFQNIQCGCFDSVCIDGKPVGVEGLRQVCTKRRDRGDDDWQVPDSGVVSFNFEFPLPFGPEDDIKDVFRKFSRRQKLHLSLRGFSRLVCLFDDMVDHRSKMLLIESMRKDFSFNFTQVKHLSGHSEELKLLILRSLLPETEEPSLRGVLYDLAVWSTKGWTQEVVKCVRFEFQNLVYFNPEHPDGHYDLNLEVNADRGTAQRCLVLGRWVKLVREARNLPDISENGDFEAFWHTVLNDQKVWLSTDNFSLPGHGTMSYDWVLPRMMLGKRTAPITEEVLDAILDALRECACCFADQIRALRLVAHYLVLLPIQLRKAIDHFPAWDSKVEKTLSGRSGRPPSRGNTGAPQAFRTFRPRAEAYTLLYNRTLYHSEIVSPKLLYNPTVFHVEEVKDIRSRLGWMHTFDVLGAHDPASNLGNRHGPMNMATFDGWTLVKLLVTLEQAEEGSFLDNGYWSEQAGFYDRGFAFILPAAWVAEGPPKQGEFTVSFTSRPAEINVAARKDLARRLLGWTFAPAAPA